MKKTVVVFGLLSLGMLMLFHFGSYALFLGRAGTDFILGGIALICFLLGAFLPGKQRRHKPTVETHSGAIPDELGLTPREREVWMGICQGLSNREIADSLYVSEHTIKTHISNLLSKLGVKRRTQAIRKARDLGLV